MRRAAWVLSAALALPGPVPAQASTTAWVHRCGPVLCVGSRTWPLVGASVLSGPDHPAREVGLAVQAHLTVIRIVDFLDPQRGAYDPASWRRVDRLIASARAHGLHVELDLSTYRNLLVSEGVDPYTSDWLPFLRFVARRYAHDPTIALVAFAGEPELASAAELPAFFARVTAQWHHLDPRHLLTTGGLLHLTESGPAGRIDWQRLCGLPLVAVCAVHDYSTADERAMVAVAAWSRRHGRPWVVEELGQPQRVADAARAAHLAHVARLARSAAGIAVWNLGVERRSTSFDVGPAEPQEWAVLKSLQHSMFSRSRPAA